MSNQATEMHPEIEKFWKSAGYLIVVDVLERSVFYEDLSRFYWAIVNENDESDWRYVGWSDPVHPETKNAICTIYSIKGTIGGPGPSNETLSEKEMLRIVRLKAFL